MGMESDDSKRGRLRVGFVLRTVREHISQEKLPSIANTSVGDRSVVEQLEKERKITLTLNLKKDQLS